MGICGTGMASLAGMFHERGFRVTGSDQGIYPPMSDFLEELGIPVTEGYQPSNLHPSPDLVVVGNVIRRTNPEAVELEKSGVPFITMPRALRTYFAHDKTRIVVAGTHGKTTVSSMIAWILYHSGLDPGFMIGGIPLNFGRNYRLGEGDCFVIEGDEYDTAYFEKSPKFLHYSPRLAVITSCEFDHADIYESLDQIQTQFRAFARSLPPDGCLIACRDDEKVAEIAGHAACEVQQYGLTESPEWSIAWRWDEAGRVAAAISRQGQAVASGTLPVVGVHNLLNSLAAIAVATKLGVHPQAALDGFASFAGVKRRQEILGEELGITIIDDFAHHPTAVRVTCEGVRFRYPRRRLVAVFEPRTNTSKRAVFQLDYVPVFQAADLIVLREPPNVEGIPEWDRFSSAILARDLRALGKNAHAFPDTDEILEFLSGALQYGDIVLIMSNGSFDNVGRRLLKHVKEKHHEGSASLQSHGF